jgi:hypothetical protein
MQTLAALKTVMSLPIISCGNVVESLSADAKLEILKIEINM